MCFDIQQLVILTEFSTYTLFIVVLLLEIIFSTLYTGKYCASGTEAVSVIYYHCSLWFLFFGINRTQR